MAGPKFNPYIAVIFATIIWGSTGIFIKYLDLPTTTIAFFRAFIPTIILLVYFRIKKINLFRADLRIILLASLVSVIDFFFISLHSTIQQ